MFLSLLFTAVYYVISVFYVLLAAICLILPGKKIVGWVVQRYAKRMVQALHYIAGIKLNVIGKYNVPDGPCIIAAKHHSWFDGFCMYSQVDNLAFVTGNHLEKIPLLRGILAKLGAIVVNNCGGIESQNSLSQNATKAFENNQKILIYPEGHLSAVGTYHRYRTGVWHMYKMLNVPVVPVATNLGCYAPQQESTKKPGTAYLKFCRPIRPGLDKAEFMKQLQSTIESESNCLIAMATHSRYKESELTMSSLETIAGIAS